MMFGDRLRELRESRDMTQKQLGELVDISDRIIGYYESNNRFPKDQNVLKRLAEIFNVTIDYLLGYSFDSYSFNEKSIEDIEALIAEPDEKDQTGLGAQLNNTANSFAKVPILSTIRAGHDLYVDQQVLGYEILPREWVRDGEYFSLNVTGDSMIDEGIKDGYRVLVRRQNYVEDGKIAVVMVNGNEGILRRVFYQDRDLVLLVASNSNIPPRAYKPEEVLIQGQVVKVEFDIK